MKKHVVTYYEAEDGHRFSDEIACKKYEKDIKVVHYLVDLDSFVVFKAYGVSWMVL